MPVQSFTDWDGPTHSARPVPWIAIRRVLVLGGALALAALAVYEMYQVLVFGGLTALEGVLVALFALLVPWLALALTNSLAGGGREPRDRAKSDSPGPGRPRRSPS